MPAGSDPLLRELPDANTVEADVERGATGQFGAFILVDLHLAGNIEAAGRLEAAHVVAQSDTQRARRRFQFAGEGEFFDAQAVGVERRGEFAVAQVQRLFGLPQQQAVALEAAAGQRPPWRSR